MIALLLGALGIGPAHAALTLTNVQLADVVVDATGVGGAASTRMWANAA